MLDKSKFWCLMVNGLLVTKDVVYDYIRYQSMYVYHNMIAKVCWFLCFRVWETRMWTCERWPCLKGRCEVRLPPY